MEIKIHGYKLEGVKYEIKLNWNSKPTEAGINGGRIDMLEARTGRKKILRYEKRRVDHPGDHRAHKENPGRCHESVQLNRCPATWKRQRSILNTTLPGWTPGNFFGISSRSDLLFGLSVLSEESSVFLLFPACYFDNLVMRQKR